MIIEGQIHELQDLEHLLGLTNPANEKGRELKNKFSKLLKDAINDELYENKQNFVFTTTADF